MNDIPPLNRREFITAGVTTSIALAVRPEISMAAITTSEEGIQTETTTVPISGGTMPCYVARPKKKGPYPAILVIHEIFGVHAYIQDVCRRLAKEGYLALAPYLYSREGDVTKLESIDTIRSQVISKVPQAQVWSDLDSTVTWAKDKQSADVTRLGITGFCWGGNVTWMYAAHNLSLRAGVAWYGRLVGEVTPLQSKFPVDIAKQLKVPVLGLYGAEDKGIPQDSVEQMKKALKEGKSASEIVVYAGAEHGFHADYRPSYHEKSAKDAWNRMLSWFKKNGVK